MSRFLSFLLLLLTILLACKQSQPVTVERDIVQEAQPPPTPKVTPGTNIAPKLPTATPTPRPTAIPADDPDSYLFIDSGVPGSIVETARQMALQNPERFSLVEDAIRGENVITLDQDGDLLLANWVYVVAAPFATIADNIPLEEVVAGWQTGSNSLGPLMIDQNTAEALAHLWGPLGSNVQIVPADELDRALWSNKPSWTVIPFEWLNVDLKLIQVDGQSPFASDFSPTVYPLDVPIWLSGDPAIISNFKADWPGPATNFDQEKMTTVAMTGVTALARATAHQMELRGITTPGVSVAPLLTSVDISHISHEVPFAPDCPYPNPIGDPIFCARESYLALFQSLGTDVVELTGNHVNDWGRENFEHTITLYETARIATFGGGRTLAEARVPALFDHNGNKIAFVGCNPVGPSHAWATVSEAGSLPCDYDAFYALIRQLRDEGYVVIATQQYSEHYRYTPTNEQRADFKALVDAGASAVSGSQGHHAQGFDLYNGAFIHYGLGNLFFDQMEMLGTRQSFIDIYTIYDGQLVNVALDTSLIEDYCCPRDMTTSEREELLKLVFEASGW